MVGKQYIALTIFPVLFLLNGFLIWKYASLKETISTHFKSIGVFASVLILVLNAYTIWHLSQESFIYYWDFSGFWRRQVELMTVFHNGENVLTYVFQTIKTQEYSSLPQLFLLPHVLWVGDSYTRFILAMVNTFLIPSQILMYIWFLNLSRRWGIRSLWFDFILGVFLVFFTGNYLPLILGYVGSSGLLWIVSTLILTEHNHDTTVSPLRYIWIGISFVLLVMLRRWFAYYVVSYYALYPSTYVIDKVINREFNVKSTMILLLNFTISGLTALFILSFGFREIIISFTQYDYKYAYQSVYTGLQSALPWFINFYSPFQVGLFALGTLFGFTKKETRQLTLFSIGGLLFSVILFYQVQIFGSHHYYIINVLSQILIVSGLACSFKLVKQNVLRVGLVGLISTLLMSNFLILFLRQDTQLSILLRHKFQGLSTSLNAPPRVSSNVDTIRDMVRYLQSITQPYEYIYVLSGSGNLNDDMLRNAFLPDEINPLPTIEATKQLDTRDGVPSDFFIYTYLVVADPIQYHNGEAYQHVIGDLAKGILYDPELRPYYYLMNTYSLSSKTITVYIYKRIDDIPTRIREKYSAIYRNLYPYDPKIYTFN